MPIRCGVPQGSVLGPLLFLRYINDLPNSLSKLKVILFADDSAEYTSKSTESLTEVVNNVLQNLSEWFKVNKLSLNVTKTNFLVVGGNRHINTAQLYLNGNAIRQKHHVKFLGIVLDGKLEWR